MAKSSGIGAALLVDGVNLSNDVGQVNQIACPVGQFDVTGLDSEANERVPLIRDGMIDYQPFFNPAAARAHATLSSLPTGDRVVSFLHRANIQGAAGACLVGKQLNYDGTRAADGSLTFATANTGNSYGLEWGDVLTEGGIATSTGAENLASLDGSTSTAFGFQAYLQVIAFTGTSATVTIESSSDDGVGDAFAAVTGGAFTAATAVGAERIATSASESIERYLRAAITGTYSNFEFVVVVNRNQTATVF